MSTYSPFETIESLSIGTVDFVSPNEIKATLDIFAPESVALNTGLPRLFPRINGYLLVPSDAGYVVGQIEWLGIERAPYPKRKGLQDFGLIDLPYPLRKISLNPVGILSSLRESSEKESAKFKFTRGVTSFPSVGDQILLPTQNQLCAIIESGEKLKIGTSPLADNANVSVNPDRLFGRHLAVLGNTGSGKSCSVAGLIRWSIETAQKENSNSLPNARFIVLDPNGEYSKAFGPSNTSKIQSRTFKVEIGDSREKLRVPLWFWNSAEWVAFTQASTRTQRPAIIHALRNIRDGKTEPAKNNSQETRRFLRTLVTIIRLEKKDGTPWGKYPKNRSFYEKLVTWQKGGGLENSEDFSQDESRALQELKSHMDSLISPRATAQYPQWDFLKNEIDKLLLLTSEAHHAFGGSDSDLLPIDPDIPREFTEESLLRNIEASAEMLNVSEYVDTLLTRVRTLLGDNRMKSIMESEGIELIDWLNKYIGDDKQEENITIIDLSLVPTEVIHIITAVISRMVFEALQRYRKSHDEKKTLPTVMVIEEAHTFVKRYREDIENQDATSVCCRVFERIAREGRKFGLGLVVSSQRPSELSPTVLSQCNTFLLHRISNDRDQDIVQRFIPDNLRGLLRELPSLPSQNAILMGWASELPVLVKMNDLPKEQQPQSDDPDFWDVWTRKKSREADWQKIADDWQGISSSSNDSDTSSE